MLPQVKSCLINEYDEVKKTTQLLAHMRQSMRQPASQRDNFNSVQASRDRDVWSPPPPKSRVANRQPAPVNRSSAPSQRAPQSRNQPAPRSQPTSRNGRGAVRNGLFF